MQHIIQSLQHNPIFFACFVGVLSLLLGSFLNVVITRLPVILERIYAKEWENFAATSAKIVNQTEGKTFNLFVPRSQCPKCLHQIKALENIPIISFICLRGKCSYCKQAISLTYPCVEALTCLLSLLVVWKFGVGAKTFCGLMLIWLLIAQSWIDFNHMIIPDEITMPGIWLGLIVNCYTIFTTAKEAIIGACAGYLILWAVYWAFKLLTNKDGMGYGDFKLLAMLGAWLGWQQLPLIIIFSSFLGAGLGLILISCKKKHLSSEIPFGPYLALAGLVSLLYGQEINALYLQYLA